VTLAIQLEHVSVNYRGHSALSDLSLAIGASEALSVVGPSGSGKTTLVRVLLGLLAPRRGIVRLDGEIASADGRLLLSPEERGLGVVFQDLALWPHLTVYGNLEFGLRAKGIPSEERERRISGVLQRVGLAGKERRRPGQLSGGERQRVAIARAVVLHPRALLLDEPLSNLDVVLTRELLSILAQLAQETRMTLIYVTHDLRESIRLARRFAVIEAGRLSQVGGIDELTTAPATPFVRALVEEFR